MGPQVHTQDKKQIFVPGAETKLSNVGVKDMVLVCRVNTNFRYTLPIHFGGISFVKYGIE